MTIRKLELSDMDAAASVHRTALLHALPIFEGLHSPEEDRWYFREKARSTYSSLHAWTFQRNAVARSFYESRKFLKVKETDGSDNAEKEPDILYFWSRGS